MEREMDKELDKLWDIAHCITSQISLTKPWDPTASSCASTALRMISELMDEREKELG